MQCNEGNENLQEGRRVKPGNQNVRKTVGGRVDGRLKDDFVDSYG